MLGYLKMLFVKLFAKKEYSEGKKKLLKYRKARKIDPDDYEVLIRWANIRLVKFGFDSKEGDTAMLTKEGRYEVCTYDYFE